MSGAGHDQNLIRLCRAERMLGSMTAHAKMISEWFAYVQPLYWPVLCLEIVRFWLFVWADAEEHGVSRQMIVAVNDHGRIRIKYIEDAPPEDWRALLSSNAAIAAELLVPTPRDVIAGSSFDVTDPVCWTPWPRHGEPKTAPSRPILDPG